MTASPRVTVFIPAFNREALIGESVASVLAQTWQDFELLVVDDGSTDRTCEIVSSFGDPRVRLVSNGENLGIPRTRNRGLELARGEYIAILDSDDRMRPERLARQVAFLDANPDYTLVGSWGTAINPAGRPTGRHRIQPTAPEDVDAHLLFRCCISNRSVMARTAVLREYGYDNEFLRCQDYDLFVRLSERHRMGNLPEILVEGRKHPGQITINTPGLGDRLKQRIAARQLDELGIAYGEGDLAKHVQLSRTRQSGLKPDRAFLEWAESWLTGIVAANMRVGRYDQRALAEAAAEVWLKVCGAAIRGGQPWAVLRFIASPLRQGSTAGFRRSLASRVSRIFSPARQAVPSAAAGATPSGRG